NERLERGARLAPGHGNAVVLVLVKVAAANLPLDMPVRSIDADQPRLYALLGRLNRIDESAVGLQLCQCPVLIQTVRQCTIPLGLPDEPVEQVWIGLPEVRERL